MGFFLDRNANLTIIFGININIGRMSNLTSNPRPKCVNRTNFIGTALIHFGVDSRDPRPIYFCRINRSINSNKHINKTLDENK